MLYVPNEFANVENVPVDPSGAVSLAVTVAPGVAVPIRLTYVTPTTGLLGDIDPVSAA